ncbi:MAG TPA: ABC transporter permease [Burkholderiaceae bacterium]|nr:ABC transporter permease [Burkholderiaceae bacterium]
MKPVLLWTDGVVLALLLALIWYARSVAKTPHLASTWRQAFRRPLGSAAATVLALFAIVGLLDCVHYREALPSAPGEERAWSPETLSALDALLSHVRASRETTYSRPLALFGYEKQAIALADGRLERAYPRLSHAGTTLTGSGDALQEQWRNDVGRRSLLGLVGGALAIAVLILLTTLWQNWRMRTAQEAPRGDLRAAWRAIARGHTSFPVRAVLITLGIVCLIGGPILSLSTQYHVFGTDRIGNDLLYRVLKSIRTALVIGTMTTLVTLPLSVGLGLIAGFVRGWVDEAIQYVYTVINSIPYVLLIAAAILLLIVFIDGHPDAFPTSAQRTDARLFFLCVILGLSSWTDLCRLVRGEVLKLRELDFVQAAQAFGVSNRRIMRVHLLPNVMHVVLINVVIRFSELVLAEATLSYVGVGVDPAMASFGTLINTARLELGRDPVIWWTLASAFAFLFALVLSANYFADAVRDAFDPRAAKLGGR